MNLEPALHDVIDAGWCPHLAMLLQRREEVAPTLASFYGLGAQRNGWLFHRSRIDGADADRRGLTAAGLDVAAPAQQAHLDRLAEMHDCVLVVERAAPSLVRTRGR